MSDRFNQLTPAQAERLAMLAEECGEVIQIVGKILRHGYDNHHPNDPTTTNRHLLIKELSDVNAVLQAMGRAELINANLNNNPVKIWAQKLRYTHHQEKPHE
jgi:hypothetical protein